LILHMRSLLLASLFALTGCLSATDTDPVEPAPPSSPDADTSPMQTPNALVLAGNYDQSCTRDDECVAVFEGNACEPVRCANAAIHRDGLVEYRAELGAYWSCQAPKACPAGQPVMGDQAICRAGRCTLPGL
jgi:hypothetical protein